MGMLLWQSPGEGVGCGLSGLGRAAYLPEGGLISNRKLLSQGEPNAQHSWFH